MPTRHEIVVISQGKIKNYTHFIPRLPLLLSLSPSLFSSLSLVYLHINIYTMYIYCLLIVSSFLHSLFLLYPPHIILLQEIQRKIAWYSSRDQRTGWSSPLPFSLWFSYSRSPLQRIEPAKSFITRRHHHPPPVVESACVGK